jgi:uncharacterized protein YjlB
MSPSPEALLLADDGLVPNNPRLPLLLYRGVLAPGGAGAEDAIIARFAANGWGGAWVDGIYPFHHYHASCHEVLGIARGFADVLFGGPRGRLVRLDAGDAVLIPAGVGHCRTGAAADLSVVGAYPAGQEQWDLRRATAADREEALRLIPHVPRPARDPVSGGELPWPA